jgi:hypothetical protein
VSWLHAIIQRYRVSEDPLRTLRRIEMIALLLGVLVCLQLAYGAIQLAAISGPDPVQPAPDSLQVPAVLGPAVVAANERNEIITRPLFWAGRQPADAVETQEEPKGKAGELKGVKLVGVFGSGERAGIIALVKGKKQRILVGERLEGWTLESIEAGEIVLANGQRSESLTLQRGSVLKAAPATKKAPAAATGRPVRQYTPPASTAEAPAAASGLSLGPRGDKN